MNLAETMAQLAAKGSESIKRTLLRHGAKEPFFGVKVGDLKVLQKQIKGDQALALQLFATGVSDAQYLAGLVADGRKMTRAQIQTWAETAAWSMISNHPVAWVASEHPEGFDLACGWIDSPNELIAGAGWNTLSALATTIPDDQLPLKRFSALLGRVVKTLPMAKTPDAIRYAMNGFVIACGSYVAPLGEEAMVAARRLGRVEVDMGDTACEVPEAERSIVKARRGAAIAPKRKTVRC